MVSTWYSWHLQFETRKSHGAYSHNLILFGPDSSLLSNRTVELRTEMNMLIASIFQRNYTSPNREKHLQQQQLTVFKLKSTQREKSALENNGLIYGGSPSL